MAKQRFSIAFREALWEVHGKKCLYCKKSLRFFELEVDHVLPESLQGDPEKLGLVLRDLGLGESFDLLGYENLAPACRRCNGDKGDELFRVGSPLITLSRVSSKIQKIRELLEEKRHARDLDNTLRHIARSIEQGKYDAAELRQGLEAIQKYPNGIRGSKSSAPPRSPEDRIDNLNIRDDFELRVTAYAWERMRERRISLRSLNKIILSSIKTGDFLIHSTHKNARTTYSVCADDLVVVFGFDDEKVTIITVMHQDR